MEKRGCFRSCCLGCLVLGGAALLVAVILGVLGFAASRREPKVEPVERSHGVVSPEELPRTLEGAPMAPPPAGRVELDVGWGVFLVRAGPPGQPVRLEGTYDTAGFELQERYEQDASGAWVYRVSLERRGLHLFFSDEDTSNRLELTIPSGVPVALSGEIGIGQSALELGGLTLTSVDLDLGTGEHQIDFDEPLPIPLERLRIKASIGELRLYSLGNASPASIEVSHRVGEVDVDLTGSWQRDADVAVRCGIGECRVTVPDDVRVDLAPTRVMIGEARTSTPDAAALAPDAPTLRLFVKATIGEVSVD